MNKIKFAFGILIWILPLCFGFICLNFLKTNHEKIAKDKAWVKTKVKDLLEINKNIKIEIVFNHWRAIRAGDKIYLEDNKSKEIGIIYAKKYDILIDKWIVYSYIYPEYKNHLNPQSDFTLMKNPINPVWVIDTLLPEETKQEALEVIKKYLEKNQKDMLSTFKPILLNMLNKTYKILENNFPKAFNLHKDTLVAELKNIKSDCFDETLKPVFDKELWPLFEKHSKDVLKPIIKKIWKEFPKFEVAFLWLYESIPGTKKTYVEKRLENFFKEKALKIIKENQDELEKIPVNVIKDISKNKELHEAFILALKKIILNDNIFSILKDISITLYKQNYELIITEFDKEVAKNGLKEKLIDFSKGFEPHLAYIVNIIFLDKNKRSINPGLAKVIKREVLYKDRYFIVLKSNMATPNLLTLKFSGKIDDE